MKKENIEFSINDISDNELRITASEFVSFLTENDMTFERDRGYWKNQSYWYVKYKNEAVCFILINAKGDEEKFSPFTVWSDDSGSDWFRDGKLEKSIESTALEHIDICEKCGACHGGVDKQIFGKKYSNVCRTTFRFINPTSKELTCLEQLALLRKNDIDKRNFEVMIERFFESLGTHKNMVLSTTDGEKVHSRMMSIVCIENKFYFQTDSAFDKCRDVEKNFNVALCIDNIQIEGECKRTGVPCENKKFCELFKFAYPKAYELYTMSENEVLYEIKPTFIKCWIYENNQPFIERFDIKNKGYMKLKYKSDFSI